MKESSSLLESQQGRLGNFAAPLDTDESGKVLAQVPFSARGYGLEDSDLFPIVEEINQFKSQMSKKAVSVVVKVLGATLCYLVSIVVAVFLFVFFLSLSLLPDVIFNNSLAIAFRVFLIGGTVLTFLWLIFSMFIFLGALFLLVFSHTRKNSKLVEGMRSEVLRFNHDTLNLKGFNIRMDIGYIQGGKQAIPMYSFVLEYNGNIFRQQ